MKELHAAGLSEEQVDTLWDLYQEARKAQEDWAGGNAGQPQATGATQAAQASGKVGMFALGVLSRLLTVLKLMYSVSVHYQNLACDH